MKTREGFVSNSSATSFLIFNITREPKTLVDFVEENPQLLDQFLREYGWYKKNPNYTLTEMIRNATEKNITFKPLKATEVLFGDNYGPYGDTPLGTVYDYMLRDGGTSKSFRWEFKEFCR